jgi:hypothetical protein
MRKVFAIVIIGVLYKGLPAQFEQFSLTAPFLLYPSFSAPVLNDTIWINVDAVPDTFRDTLGNPVGIDPVIYSRVFYSTNNQASWDSLNLSLLGYQFYENTYENFIIYPGTGNTFWYFRAVDDSGKNFSTGSPKNAGNTFPVPLNLCAKACIEPGNDVQPGAPGNFLELTDFHVSYSDNKIFGVLSNATGTWPWDEGGWIPLEWYAYGFGIINPYHIMEDTFYVAVRADAPVYITDPGVYKIITNGGTQINYIGPIQHQTSGGKLHIGFDLSILLNDPNFGPFYGVLAVAAATAWANLSGAYFADGTQPTRWYLKTYMLIPGQNTPPVLTESQVIPPSGDTLTLFDFKVKYFDNENNLPPLRKLYIDDTLIYTAGTPDHYYADTSIFMVNGLGYFSPGWHKFYFKFSDGQYVVQTPIDSFFVQGLYIAENPNLKRKEPILTILNSKKLSEILKGKDIKIFDFQGREILANKEVSKGVYFLKIKNRGKTYLRKVVILK